MAMIDGEELKKMAAAPTTADEDASITDADIKHEKDKIDINIKKEELESRKQDRQQRGEFAYRIFTLVRFYIIVVLGIVICAGDRLLFLNDNVLNVLLSTSLASVIGLFTIVAKYLFPNKS